MEIEAKLQKAVERIRSAGRSAGKNMWMIGDGVACAKNGFTFLCVGETTAMLSAALAETNRRVKG